MEVVLRRWRSSHFLPLPLGLKSYILGNVLSVYLPAGSANPIRAGTLPILPAVIYSALCAGPGPQMELST